MSPRAGSLWLFDCPGHGMKHESKPLISLHIFIIPIIYIQNNNKVVTATKVCYTKGMWQTHLRQDTAWKLKIKDLYNCCFMSLVLPLIESSKQICSPIHCWWAKMICDSTKALLRKVSVAPVFLCCTNNSLGDKKTVGNWCELVWLLAGRAVFFK